VSEIREFEPGDWDEIWPIFRTIVEAGETYAYDPGLDSDGARELWVRPPPDRTVVAVEDGRLLGTAKMGPNRPGAGAHVATASFMVEPGSAGRGVGRKLAEHALAWATAAGYHGMQFNAVVQTNVRATALWRSLGFELIGTVPEAFRLPDGSLTGLQVMYRRLSPRSRL
jgi:L-amino acid N-acyltransferase YncA